MQRTMPDSELPTGTVTFLFTDIEGSTRLLQRIGEVHRDLRAVVQAQRALSSHSWPEGEVVRAPGGILGAWR
jgi:class 3 adenylate cyclase